ncbi:hypothetical protein AAZV13_13G254900 [Glycine max]
MGDTIYTNMGFDPQHKPKEEHPQAQKKNSNVLHLLRRRVHIPSGTGQSSAHPKWRVLITHLNPAYANFSNFHKRNLAPQTPISIPLPRHLHDPLSLLPDWCVTSTRQPSCVSASPKIWCYNFPVVHPQTRHHHSPGPRFITRTHRCRTPVTR